MTKERLDLIVQRKTGCSRSKAQGLILSGNVFSVTGDRLDKPGVRLDPGVEIEVRDGPRFVSRGGEKLQAAFDAWPVSVAGLVCIDAGASTGGFTDCLLANGARKVFAVDVGYGQLAWTLRQDPRVVVMERCNVRHLRPEALDEKPQFFTVDCSFISLALLLPALYKLLEDTAEGILLIKPQFEAGREQVGKGGVVRDPGIHAQVVENVTMTALEVGFETCAVLPSPLLGPKGNREFLAHLRRTSSC